MTGPARPRLCQVVFDTTDARASAEFWRQLLGLVYPAPHELPPSGEDDPEGRDWLNLNDEAGRPTLAFQQVDAIEATTWPDAAVPQQLHLDLMVDTVAEQDEVHDRVLDLGGELRLDRADDPDEPLRVYADPAGHTFCVFVGDTAVLDRQLTHRER